MICSFVLVPDVALRKENPTLLQVKHLSFYYYFRNDVHPRASIVFFIPTRQKSILVSKVLSITKWLHFAYEFLSYPLQAPKFHFSIYFFLSGRCPLYMFPSWHDTSKSTTLGAGPSIQWTHMHHMSGSRHKISPALHKALK